MVYQIIFGLETLRVSSLDGRFLASRPIIG
ncbi:hypothetical protein FHR95_001761 [Halomonas fontilapidosi]|uniref:Uncharacterized protein n=1 Tax=Halomonas fontilapidosi TaxID=616675 RepID=A0A7W5DKE9_9GAMM|nr:hypothetical protein [Halomonas fontilapidosi]